MNSVPVSCSVFKHAASCQSSSCFSLVFTFFCVLSLSSHVRSFSPPSFPKPLSPQRPRRHQMGHHQWRVGYIRPSGAQQLRDTQTSLDALRTQVGTLQQQLSTAERERDIALLRIDMLYERGDGGGRSGPSRRRRNEREEYRPRRRRSERSHSPPRRMVRCETRYPDGGACTSFVPAHSDSEGDDGNRRRDRSPSRVQVLYPRSQSPAVRRSPSAGPSHTPRITASTSRALARSYLEPSPSLRPHTPSMRGSTVRPDGGAAVTAGAGGIELTVTPRRPGAVPVSFIISPPQEKDANR
ncbi:hypothetical protein R3P38DRAFT_3060921 [Favolaschia claudopus]|uniref:Uncharacterized protein n=1 Tax=Favolaschia claudopus TaxID=2862362 RepID=A0AAW0A1T5_9AGAR